MRNRALWHLRWALIFMSVAATFSQAQAHGGFRVPSEPQHDDPTVYNGQRQIDQAKTQAEINQHASGHPWAAADADKLKHLAQELADLAQSIPPDVDQTTKGLLPKDLDQKLKHLEKLSKQLRSDILH
jgi:hypothetical protein